MFHKIFPLLLSCSLALCLNLLAPPPTPIKSQSEEIRFALVQTLGRGTVNSTAWSPDGETLAVGGSLGVHLYTNDNQNGRLLEGHPENVYLLAWHPENTLLASVSNDAENSDRKIIVWDTQQNRRENILSGHTGGIQALVWSPDGRLLASASSDNTLCIWSKDNLGRWQSYLLADHTDSLSMLMWSPDGTKLTASSADGTIYLWTLDAHSGAWQVLRLTGHANDISGIAWSSDSKLLASGDKDGLVYIWRWNDSDKRWEPSQSYKQAGSVFSLAWHPTNEKLASGDVLGNIIVWDTSVHDVFGQFRRVSKSVYQLFWTSGGKQLLSAGDEVIIWDIAPDGTSTFKQITKEAVISLRPESTQFITIAQNTIELRDASTGQLLDTLLSHNGSLDSVVWHPNGNWLGSLSSDGWIRTWDAVTGERLLSFPADIFAESMTVSWNGDWTQLAGVSESVGGLAIFDWQQIATSPSPLHSLPIIIRLNEFSGYLVGTSWSTDGSKFVGITSISEPYPLVYNTANWIFTGSLEDSRVYETLTLAPRPSRSVNQMAIGGRYFDAPGFIQIWDLDSNTPIGDPFFIDSEAVEALAWSPDGNTLASLDQYKDTVYLWDVVNQASSRLSIPNEMLTSIAWSSTNLLAVSSADKIYIWDINSPQASEVAILQGKQLRITDIAWSPDGSKLAAANSNGTISIWQK